jgi:glycosyltransferase involved in cell wall biosynthesis
VTRRLCFVTTYPPDLAHLGGGGWVDRRLIAALRAAGADVTVFAVTGAGSGGTADAAGDVPLEVRGDRRALARVVATMLTSTQPYLSAKFTAFPGWDEAAAALRAHAVDRQVVTSQWPPLLLASAAGVDVAVHIAHNVDSVIAARHAPLPLRALGERRRLVHLERSLLRGPRAVLALSRLDIDRLGEWGVRAVQLPMPLSPARGVDEPGPLRVGFIGKASWPPNAEALDVLLGPVHDSLSAQASPAVYVIGGSGTDEFADHPRVVQSGHVADLDDFYGRVDVAVVPRPGESTGISVKMLEAAEYGVPVIVPTSLADAVDPDGPWLVADSPAEVAEAIARCSEADAASTRDWVSGRPEDAAAEVIFTALDRAGA